MRFHISFNPLAEDLKVYSNLKSQKETDHFIAESEKVVIRLLESDLEIISIYLTEDQFNSNKDLITSHEQQSECSVFIGMREEMEKIVGFSLHQRILATAKIPVEIPLDELLNNAMKPLLFVILDEVCDAENIGAMIRTSNGMNATAIIIDKKSTTPWMRRAVRVSMGAVFKIPIVTVDSIPRCIEKLKSSGVKTFATTLSENAKAIWDCNFTNDIAIVFGSEGQGIKQEIVEACNEEVIIPMPDSSLNVGIAQGIFLYEVNRQREPIG